MVLAFLLAFPLALRSQRAFLVRQSLSFVVFSNMNALFVVLPLGRLSFGGLFVALHVPQLIHGAVNGSGIVTILFLEFFLQKLRHDYI